MKGIQSKIRTRVQSQVLDNGNRITDEGKECDRTVSYTHLTLPTKLEV